MVLRIGALRSNSAARGLVFFFTSNVQSLISALLHYEERAPRNQEGQLHGARGAEVLTVGGNLSASAAGRDRRTCRAKRTDALAAQRAVVSDALNAPVVFDALGLGTFAGILSRICSVDRANAPGSAQQSSAPVRVSF